MVKAKIFNGNTYYTIKGIGWRVIITLYPNNSTLLVGVPDNGKSTPTSVREHTTRKDALAYIIGALNLKVAA